MTINLPGDANLLSGCCAGLIWMLLFLLFIYAAGYCWRSGALHAERDEVKRALKAKGGDA